MIISCCFIWGTTWLLNLLITFFAWLIHEIIALVSGILVLVITIFLMSQSRKILDPIENYLLNRVGANDYHQAGSSSNFHTTQQYEDHKTYDFEGNTGKPYQHYDDAQRSADNKAYWDNKEMH